MTITEDYLTKIIAERDARIAILELHCADAVAEMHHAKDDARRARAEIDRTWARMADWVGGDELDVLRKQLRHAQAERANLERQLWAAQSCISPPIDVAQHIRRILDSGDPLRPMLEGLYNDLITTDGKDG